MAEPKTRPTGASVVAFLKGIPDPERQREARTLVALMRAATGARPTMWGSSIIGFGRYRYGGSSGRTTEWPATGFSPRSTGFSIYIMTGLQSHKPLLRNLGKHKEGKGCLYVRTLADVHLPTLRRLVTDSVRTIRARAG